MEDRTAIFDEEFFSYKDEYGNIQQYYDGLDLYLSNIEMRNLLSKMSTYMRCYIGIFDDDYSYKVMPDSSELVGFIKSVTTISTNNERNIYIDYAAAPTKIGTPIMPLEQGKVLIIFYFENNEPSDSISVIYSQEAIRTSTDDTNNSDNEATNETDNDETQNNDIIS